VRFDSRSRGIAAQQLMSLLKLVTLINKHPDGAIEHGQFGEARQPGHSRERWKISVELNHPPVTVHMRRTMIFVFRGGRSPINGDAAEGVAEIGGEIDERSRGAGEEDDPALPIDHPRNQPEGEAEGCPDRYVVAVSEGGQRDRPLVLDDSQLEAAVGGGRRAQRRGQRRQRVGQIPIVLSDARREILNVREYGSRKIHTRAPRKRIRPLIVPA
jgi:hypothetical protein